MRCAECGCYAAAYATKFWDNVIEFAVVAAQQGTAERRTPDQSCNGGCHVLPALRRGLTDEQRRQMVDDALTDPACGIDGWMHRGQTLDALPGRVGRDGAE